MNGSKIVPLIDGDPNVLAKADKKDLISMYGHYRAMTNDMLRHAILVDNRVDLLATMVLGYQVSPMHLSMMRFQFLHPKSLQFAFRGAGKTTVCTVTKAIHWLLKDPNFRVALNSKSMENAFNFLKEIKGHFESNERLIEIFGNYYDAKKVSKWDNKEIVVAPRTKFTKEASITCVSIKGTVVSRHFDGIITDDMVDDENCTTPHARSKMRIWYYKILVPTLMPPNSEVPHRGEHHILGTPYHYEDQYNHLIKNELKEHHQIIPSLLDGKSAWPEMYSPEYFEQLKEESGTIIFESQYQCNTEAMKGEVFDYDDCQKIDDADIPSELRIYQGVDLAISEDVSAAQFAIVIIGIDKTEKIYVLDFFLGKIRFGAQIKKFWEFYDDHDPIIAAIETNAYQQAFKQEIEDIDKDVRVEPVNTDKDKMIRAWKLQPIFNNKRVFFRKNQGKLIDQFVLFPSYKYKDGFDAFDLAYRVSKKKKKRRRRSYEPGVI